MVSPSDMPRYFKTGLNLLDFNFANFAEDFEIVTFYFHNMNEAYNSLTDNSWNCQILLLTKINVGLLCTLRNRVGTKFKLVETVITDLVNCVIVGMHLKQHWCCLVSMMTVSALGFSFTSCIPQIYFKWSRFISSEVS